MNYSLNKLVGGDRILVGGFTCRKGVEWGGRRVAGRNVPLDEIASQGGLCAGDCLSMNYSLNKLDVGGEVLVGNLSYALREQGALTAECRGERSPRRALSKDCRSMCVDVIKP